MDRRGTFARRFRDVVLAYKKQLGGELNQLQETAVRNIATMTIAMEKMEQAAATGQKINEQTYSKLSNDISRRLRDLGLLDQTPYGRTISDDDDVVSDASPPPDIRAYAKQTKQGQAT